MIPDNRQPGRYGIETVVEDLHSERIPTTVNRTLLEARQLRHCLQGLARPFETAFDIGCGYGRLMPVLEDFAEQVNGVERDQELRAIAQKLNPYSKIFPDWKELKPEIADLVLTYTHCQHLDLVLEFYPLRDGILKLLKPNGIWIAVEQGFMEEDFKLPVIRTEERIMEATHPEGSVGRVYVMRKP